MENDKGKKGFAGLDSMVSDVEVAKPRPAGFTPNIYQALCSQGRLFGITVLISDDSDQESKFGICISPTSNVSYPAQLGQSLLKQIQYLSPDLYAHLYHSFRTQASFTTALANEDIEEKVGRSLCSFYGNLFLDPQFWSGVLSFYGTPLPKKAVVLRDYQVSLFETLLALPGQKVPEKCDVIIASPLAQIKIAQHITCLFLDQRRKIDWSNQNPFAGYLTQDNSICLNEETGGKLWTIRNEAKSLKCAESMLAMIFLLAIKEGWLGGCVLRGKDNLREIFVRDTYIASYEAREMYSILRALLSNDRLNALGDSEFANQFSEVLALARSGGFWISSE